MFKSNLVFLKNQKKGFTLIELLIVIAVMAILTTVVFVALNPLARFQDARNNRRWTDVTAYMQAIKLYQVDHGGLYCDSIESLTAENYYQIGAPNEDCNLATGGYTCGNPTVALDADCVDFEELLDDGYIPQIMVDPNDSQADEDYTKYYIQKNTNGTILIGSCSEELGSNDEIPVISVTR